MNRGQETIPCREAWVPLELRQTKAGSGLTRRQGPHWGCWGAPSAGHGGWGQELTHCPEPRASMTLPLLSFAKPRITYWKGHLIRKSLQADALPHFLRTLPTLSLSSRKHALENPVEPFCLVQLLAFCTPPVPQQAALSWESLL